MIIPYQARKIPGYVLEPKFDATGVKWESHHATNPSPIRLTGDDRVFLGYRAGGDRDHYVIGDTEVHSSSFGMAVLDETGERVLHRFPWPVMRIRRTVPLPQSPDEFPGYMEKHRDLVCVMHDFRLFEHEGYLHIIYHDGTIETAFDVIKRMKVSAFLERIGASVELARRPAEEIAAEWAALWYGDGVWQPCGFEGGRLIFPTVDGKTSLKTDIVYLKLRGGIQMMRRPLPDVAVLKTADLCGSRAPDGDQQFGVLEQCVRPGFFDNSHIGPNGIPSRATIGRQEVYIDVCHGVHNEALCKDGPFEIEMTYSPFFRVKDAKTGDLLYYSELPVIDPDDPVWDEYARYGRWVGALPHKYIMFVGGQTEVRKGRTGEDDVFTFYTGVGDTAVARAEFTVRELLPPDVLLDISRKYRYDQVPVMLPKAYYNFDRRIAGWTWRLKNDTPKRCIAVERRLETGGGIDYAARYIYTRPGYFDAHALSFDGKSVRLVPGVGYCLIYKGVRWTEEDGAEKSTAGFGVLVLDEENPERVLYRSTAPVEDYTCREDGFVNAAKLPTPGRFLENVLDYIPAQAVFEIRRTKELAAKGLTWRSHHTQWLERRGEKHDV